MSVQYQEILQKVFNDKTKRNKKVSLRDRFSDEEILTFPSMCEWGEVPQPFRVWVWATIGEIAEEALKTEMSR